MQPTIFLSMETWTGLGVRRRQSFKRDLASMAYRVAFSDVKVKYVAGDGLDARA